MKFYRRILNNVFFRTISSFLNEKQYRDIIYVTVVVLILGTVVYHYAEDWRWIDSLYFSMITLTTVGYGDFHPQTDLGKLFTIFYIIVGVGIILSFVDAVHTHFNPRRRRKKNL